VLSLVPREAHSLILHSSIPAQTSPSLQNATQVGLRVALSRAAPPSDHQTNTYFIQATSLQSATLQPAPAFQPCCYFGSLCLLPSISDSRYDIANSPSSCRSWDSKQDCGDHSDYQRYAANVFYPLTLSCTYPVTAAVDVVLFAPLKASDRQTFVCHPPDSPPHMAAQNFQQHQNHLQNTFPPDDSGYSGSPTLFKNDQQFADMMSYSHPPSFPPINGIATTMAGSEGSIDPTLGPSMLSSGEMDFWDTFKNVNFSPPPGSGAGNMWSLPKSHGEPVGTNIRNGQPTPPQDMMSVEEGDSMAEGKTKARKRSRASNGEGRRKSRKNSKVDLDEDISHLNPEELAQREKFLERNRVAASKCRQKKKEWTNSLEERARELQAQREMLVAYVSMLRNELLMLKCKCLEHSDCKCERVREYLKNTVATLPPASANLYNMSQIEDELKGKSRMPSFNEGSFADLSVSDGMPHSRSNSMAHSVASPSLDFLKFDTTTAAS
jgi:hypothetical protein